MNASARFTAKSSATFSRNSTYLGPMRFTVTTATVHEFLVGQPGSVVFENDCAGDENPPPLFLSGAVCFDRKNNFSCVVAGVFGELQDKSTTGGEVVPRRHHFAIADGLD